ncbi:MAG: FAD-dependent thymidylate synthase, partial [Longimicrobiales bacterium]
SVLPNATETKIVVTGNARTWRHFIELRASESAEAEIRVLAMQVLRALQLEAPHIFGDYAIRSVDGGEVADTEYRSV